MTSVIYYFSGTGNSLHVARELKNRLPNARVIPIVGALKSRKTKKHADTIGIVFPIHAHTFPWVVEQFLTKCDLSSASYLFACATRECTDKVFSDMDKILMNQQTQLTSSFAVETPENFIPVFAVSTEDEVMLLEKHLQEKLDIIAKLIKSELHPPQGGCFNHSVRSLQHSRHSAVRGIHLSPIPTNSLSGGLC